LCDEFSSEFDAHYPKKALCQDKGKKQRNKPNRLSDSEAMAILIVLHLSGMRNLKAYYLFYACKHMKGEFPQLVSYNRFVELQGWVCFP